MGTAAEWEPEAENWVRWARTPGHDAYWYFRDSFFDHIMPAAGRRTLEIGSGEGRVARDLAARGHRVTAVEPARTLARYAKQEDPVSGYAVAAGAALPFPDACFDRVVAYNALQVVDDMPATVGEAARVLDRGGYLCACIAHPVTDLGRFRGDAANSRLTIRRDYFESRRVDEAVTLDGFTMTFRGRTYSLEHYAVALEEAGLRIEAMREPRPPVDAEKHQRWQTVPLFLNIRTVKA